MLKQIFNITIFYIILDKYKQLISTPLPWPNMLPCPNACGPQVRSTETEGYVSSLPAFHPFSGVRLPGHGWKVGMGRVHVMVLEVG